MTVQYVRLSSRSFQKFITAKFVEITDKTTVDILTNIHGIDLLTSHTDSEEKSSKQRQRLYTVRKREGRATIEKEVSKTCVEKSSIPNKTDVHNNNNRDGTLCMSNSGELSSSNCAAVDSPNVPSEAHTIVDKYLQSQKDLADRAKKKIYWRQLVMSVMKGLSSARKWGNNTTQNGKGTPDHFQNSRKMNNNATEWKCRWPWKSQRIWIMNENATKRKKEMARKVQRTGILLKFSKVGRSVIDWRSK